MRDEVSTLVTEQNLSPIILAVCCNCRNGVSTQQGKRKGRETGRGGTGAGAGVVKKESETRGSASIHLTEQVNGNK